MIQFDDLVLHDLNEVARQLGMTRQRVDRLVRTDELAGVIHGGRWMVAQEEIDSFRSRWTPPVRPSQVGVRRRFRPPPRPAETPEEG